MVRLIVGESSNPVEFEFGDQQAPLTIVHLSTREGIELLGKLIDAIGTDIVARTPERLRQGKH